MKEDDMKAGDKFRKTAGFSKGQTGKIIVLGTGETADEVWVQFDNAVKRPRTEMHHAIRSPQWVDAEKIEIIAE